MRSTDRRIRSRRLLAAATALVGPALSTAPAAQAQNAADPPWRVGRLARIDGSVSTHGADATAWTDAVLNAPLTSGDALWCQPGAGAVIELAGSDIVLSQATELDLATMDNRQLVATEPQGELFLDLADVPPGDLYSITTPRGVVTLAGAGRYLLAAGDSASPTLIGVVAGAAHIQSSSFSLQVNAGQTATVTGNDALNGSVGPLIRDAFLDAQLGRPVPAFSGPGTIRYMTGARQLAAYGAWQPQPQYGQVWYPQVGADWAPYREGSWSYVQPWGWTWVDQEPWGFAPFHYGRWAQFGGRWGWIPGEPGAPPDAYAQPAYAPALVDFVAAGAVAGAVAGLAVAAFDHGGPGGPGGPGGNVGWIPLGPREAYQPPFHVGPTYLQRVNYGQINNTRITTVNNTTVINNFVNRNAMTVVPASAMARSEPIGRLARTGPDAFAALGHAQGGQPDLHVVQGVPPVRPDASTRGLTPVAAHGFGIGAVSRPAAPGPAIDPALFRPRQLPASRTPFRVAAATVPPGGPHPGAGPGAPRDVVPAPAQPGLRPAGAEPPRAGAPVAPVHPGLPPLRAQGAVPPGLVPHGGASGPARAEPAALPPGANRAPEGRPGAVAQPGPARPEENRREQAPAAAPRAEPARRPDAARPPVPRFEERPAPQHPDAPRMAPPRAVPFRPEPPRAQPFRPEPPRPEPPRPEPPRAMPPRPPAPHPEPQHPAPHPEPAPRGGHERPPN